jgi:hypothetical protein
MFLEYFNELDYLFAFNLKNCLKYLLLGFKNLLICKLETKFLFFVSVRFMFKYWTMGKNKMIEKYRGGFV